MRNCQWLVNAEYLCDEPASIKEPRNQKWYCPHHFDMYHHDWEAANQGLQEPLIPLPNSSRIVRSKLRVRIEED